MENIPDGIDLERHRDLAGRTWHVWARRSLLLAVAALLAIGLANVFGQATESSRAATSEAALVVDAPSSVRGGLMYTARFQVTARHKLKKATLRLSSGWFQGMQVNSIVPQPVEERSNDGWVSLVLGPVAAGHTVTSFIGFQVDPTTLGRQRQTVEVSDGPKLLLTVHRSVTVFP
jgi:hypothetical protein